MTPDLHPDLTPAEYFAEPCPAPALTNSGIGLLLNRSPAHLWRSHPALNPDRATTSATANMYLGSVVHRIALDKGADFDVIDAADFRTKAAQEARDASLGANRIPIVTGKWEQAMAMAMILNERMQDLIGGAPYETEVVFTWLEDGTWCRGMLDIWVPSLMLAIDLKTTKDASEAALQRTMVNMGYDRQTAWYLRGLDRIFPEHAGRIEFCDLFVETDAPHEANPYWIDAAWRHSSEQECLRALGMFRACLANGKGRDAWPGYPRGKRERSAPTWAALLRMEAAMDSETEETTP